LRILLLAVVERAQLDHQHRHVFVSLETANHEECVRAGFANVEIRPTPSNDEIWCGSFRTPSLRNVAVREIGQKKGARP